MCWASASANASRHSFIREIIIFFIYRKIDFYSFQPKNVLSCIGIERLAATSMNVARVDFSDRLPSILSSSIFTFSTLAYVTLLKRRRRLSLLF